MTYKFFPIRQTFQNATLRTKIILIFVILLVLPFAFFTCYTSYRVKSVVTEQTFTATEKTFTETFSILQAQLTKMETVSNLLIYNDLVYTIADADLDPHPSISVLENAEILSSTFSQIQKIAGIDNIQLYTKNNYHFINQNRISFPFEQLPDYYWYEKLTTSPSGQWFTPLDFTDQHKEGQNFFSFMRIINSPYNFSNIFAVLRIDIACPEWENALAQTNITPNCHMLLFDENKQLVLSSPNSDILFPTHHLSDFIEQTQDERWETITLNNEQYFFFCSTLAPTNWTLAAMIPYHDIYSLSQDLTFEMCIVMLVVACIAFVLALALANQILRRIQELSNTMHKVETGNSDIQIPVTSQDEIGQLITHFNHMVRKLKILMDEKVQYGVNIKHLELKALQAQINPHFLYNTLDTINCLAIRKNAPEISEVIVALASFYKISLSKGRDYIPIREEIKHAKMYLKIQNARFKNQIHATWNIAPEIEDLNIIKIVLQPIIENAAIHGIYERSDKSGSIDIKGWLDGEDVYITISDNGVGMSPEAIEANFSFSENIAAVPGGYGIRNICDRLHVAYGAEYGLSCISTPEKGTSVTIHIPMCT